MTVYTDAPNPDLLDRIPLSARRVLDVGCGQGALGAAYKRRNPAARVYGIEANPETARIAATRLDEVALVDVEVHPLPFADTTFDCIIYGDVLEHLRDPWAVLKRQVERLDPAGTLLICMPNIEHWSFTERLLRGTWDYEEFGLFDRTHLRWFSFETTRRALKAAGLLAHDVIPRIFEPARAGAFAAAMRPALDSLGIDYQHYVSRSTPLQYVWRALRQPVQQLFIMSSMLNPVGGVSDVRVIEPMRAIATDASISTRVVPSFEPPTLPEGVPKIFIFHRPLLAGETGLEPVRRLIRAGYLVVCEFDDHPDYIPVLQRPDVQNFRAMHALQTSTEPLADVLRQQNPEVAVFPNALSALPPVRNFVTPGRISLFFGGINREEDWPPCLPALNAVAALAGERLHFQIVNDRGLFDALQTPYKNFTPLCDYDTYQDILSRCEISFMPLLDSPFNRCKSDLKFIEAASYRVASLASTVVYGDSIEDGRTGLLFNDVRDLQQRLLRLVANPEFGLALGEAARAYVTEHRMLAYQVARRNQWYRSLWSRRAELHQALLARVPELFGPDLAQPAPVLHSGG